MRPAWNRLRDGIAVALAAGIFGGLLYVWLAGSSWSESPRLEEVVGAKLQELQKEQGGDAAASRGRIAAMEAELAKLQKSTPADARVLSRQEMQRWLAQRAAERPAPPTPGPGPRRVLGLLAVLALILLGLSVSRWRYARS